ncbi:MAG TPA: protease PrsW [Thermoplasmatales archaeon]|nr:protease PrsW [Thermoplasmatales archaeon]
MSPLPQGTLLLGIIFALIVLWISLKNYEGYFVEKKLFLSLIGGFVVGFLIILLEISTIGAGIFFIILFPAVEQFAKMIVTNLRTFQGKKDTPLYGLVIGLGFGAIYMPLYTIMTGTAIGSEQTMLFIALFFGVGIILFHGATGCIIGYGVASHDGSKIWKMLIITILLSLPITTLEFGLSFLWGKHESSALILSLKGVELLYGVLLYWYVTTKILPSVLPRRRRREVGL